MKHIEDRLKQIAYFGKDEPLKVDIPDFIKKSKKKFIGKGIFSRAFYFPDEDIIVKEGRWDLDLALWGETFMPLPSLTLKGFLTIFNLHLQPTKAEVKKQYNMYLEFIKYFGYFDKEDVSYFHPDKSNIIKKQKYIRENLSDFKTKVEDHFNFTIPDSINRILESDLIYTNFIPNEYTIYASSISSENEGKDTVYIMQEFIKGKPLCDFDIDRLDQVVKDKIILFLFLVLVMNMITDFTPDTRPKYPILQVANWFHKTENIIISENKDVMFIDTRWMWESKSNLVKRGFVIPELIIVSMKFYLTHLLEE